MRYKGLKYCVHSCSLLACKIGWENTQPWNMCYIIFEKAKGRGGTLDITSDYAEAAVQSGSVKKVLWEIFQNSQESTCVGIFFW